MSDNHRNMVCVSGPGYVGLFLAATFAEKLPVVGFGIDQTRIDELAGGHESTLEVDDGKMLSTSLR